MTDDNQELQRLYSELAERQATLEVGYLKLLARLTLLEEGYMGLVDASERTVSLLETLTRDVLRERNTPEKIGERHTCSSEPAGRPT